MASVDDGMQTGGMLRNGSEPWSGWMNDVSDSARDRIRRAVRRTIGENAFARLRTLYWPVKLRFTQYEPETRLLRFLVPYGGICVDAGGNFGQFASYLSRTVGPAGVVHTFEPLEYNRFVLRAVVARLPLSNIVVHPFALADYSGMAQMEVDHQNTAEAHVTDAGRGMVVECRTLDEWAAEAKLPRLDFLKIDVEGFELLLLRGATSTIDRFSPPILCEIGNASCVRYGIDGERTIGFLADRGYRTFSWTGGGLVPRDGVSEEVSNYLFLQTRHLEALHRKCTGPG